MEVIARIDINTLSGRKIVRELAKEKSVKIEYPLPDEITKQKLYTVDEAFDEGLNLLSELYGVDMRKI